MPFWQSLIDFCFVIEMLTHPFFIVRMGIRMRKLPDFVFRREELNPAADTKTDYVLGTDIRSEQVHHNSSPWSLTMARAGARCPTCPLRGRGKWIVGNAIVGG